MGRVYAYNLVLLVHAAAIRANLDFLDAQDVTGVYLVWQRYVMA